MQIRDILLTMSRATVRLAKEDLCDVFNLDETSPDVQ